MRVLFAHDRIGDEGGAEANVRHAANALRARGASVAFLHGPSTGKGDEGFQAAFSELFCHAGRAEEAVAEAVRWKPDVVYVHKLSVLPVLRALVDTGLPLVHMMHDHEMYCGRSYRYFPWNRVICTRKAGWICATTCLVVRRPESPIGLGIAWPPDKIREMELWRRFNRHIVVTNFMQSELELHGIPADKVTILPPVPKPAAPGFSADYSEPTILFVGQILRGKGLDLLLKACTKLVHPDWRLLVIGDGSHLEHCRRLSESLGLSDRVEFTGWLPQETLHEHYRHARVACVPSVWPEPIATIGLEFMQHALPVVAFDAGGMKDWLEDGVNGYLPPVLDVGALADRLDRVLADQELAAKMGAAGFRAGREQHDQEACFDELLEILTAEAGASS